MEFKNALMEKPLYQTIKSRGVKYLLYMMELNSPYPKGLPPFSTDTISVEHIMPQTLNIQWKNHLSKESMEAFDSSLHRLGNLALTNYNGEMSNRSFEEKKDVYKVSKFYYTTQIASYKEWQINEIDKRAEELADASLHIWILPQEYQQIKALPKSLHTLDEDSSQFAWTKPDILLIGSQEYQISKWMEFLPLLCKELYKENPNAFTELADSGKISLIGTETDSQSYADNSNYIKILNNIYIRNGLSSETTIETAKKISQCFDKLAGTNYENDILFSIK